MPSLWFNVPAYGRLEIARACLRQLRRTCDVLTEAGIDASAVVVANDENLNFAYELGFWGYERENGFLGKKFNDGYELAAREGVDYVVPMGSDDWIDPALILEAPLPDPYTIRCARKLTMVSEDGSEYMNLGVKYEGGIGLRITPTALLEPLRYRPAHEDKVRAIDTHTLRRLKRAQPFLSLDYFDRHAWQIVDFKSPGANLNTWAMCTDTHPNVGSTLESDGVKQDPWPLLAEHYPAEAISDMREVYEL